jgi:uncharacterized membrane protein YiaA
MEKFAQPLFFLFIAVSGNYIGQLLPCQIQTLFLDNIYAKHLLAFTSLLFAIVISSGGDKPLKELFITAFAIYLIFILMIRMDKYFFTAFIISIILVYILNIHKDKLKDEKEKEKIQKIINILQYVPIAILVSGVGLYYLEKKNEYKDNFTIPKFIFGEVSCKKNTLSEPIYISKLKNLVK